MVGRFRCPVIGCELQHAVTSRFLWLAPHKNEILDVDTSKIEAFVEEKKSGTTPVDGKYSGKRRQQFLHLMKRNKTL